MENRFKYSRQIECRKYREIDLLKWIHGGRENWFEHAHYDEQPHQWCKVSYRIFNWIDIQWIAFVNLWIDALPQPIYQKIGAII